ncbi:MAG: hypothetical protein ACP5GI_06105 [Sulfolobales archaeon]
MWIRELIDEFLEKPYQNNLLTRSYMIYPKILYLILTIIVWIVSRELMIYVAMIVVNISLLIFLKAYKTLLTSLVIWLSTFTLIILIDYLSRTLTEYTYINILYSYLTLSASLIYYLTTPAHQLRDLLGINIFTFSYTLIRSFIREALDILDSIEVRGFEIRYNLLRYIGVIYTLFKNIENRALTLEDALKARGAEE